MGGGSAGGTMRGRTASARPGMTRTLGNNNTPGSGFGRFSTNNSWTSFRLNAQGMRGRVAGLRSATRQIARTGGFRAA